MNGITIVLLCLALIGFLPLVTFLYRKRRYEKILAEGQIANARVFQVQQGVRGNYQVVHYVFLASNGRQYQGALTTKPRAYREGNVLEVYYLPDKPDHNTVKGNWNSTGMLLFMIAIGLVVSWMAYQLYEMVGHTDIRFNP